MLFSRYVSTFNGALQRIQKYSWQQWPQINQFPPFFHGSTAPSGKGLFIFEASRSHSVKAHHTWKDSSGRVISRDLYLTKHKTHKRQTFSSPAGFKPAMPASERLQKQDLDRAALGSAVLDNKLKVKFTLEQATKAQRGSIDIALLFL
jgi:hypothetical protein